MSKQLIEGYTNEDLESKIENEGFDYFFTGYIAVDSIKDESLREAVLSYHDARGYLITLLEEKGIEIYD